MARFMFKFIALSAILLNGYVVATDCDDSDETSEDSTPYPQECGDNEVLDNCPVNCPSDNCPKSRYVDQSRCTKPKACPLPACKCGFNSRRAANGTCISTRDCPPFKCKGEHEEYNPCPAYCPGEDCSQATPDGKCHLPGRIGIVVECKPACRCKKNYWRLNGTCVPYECCPNIATTETPPETTQIITEETTTVGPTTTQITTEPTEDTTTVGPTLTCGDNEIAVDCPNNCAYEYCLKSRNDGKLPCIQGDNCPPPACKCRFNFRRADNGSCIPVRQCPPFPCDGPHEEYNSCPPICPGEDCSQATPDGRCPIFGVIGIVLECEPACRCKKSYWRLNGTCVPYNQCLKCSDPNEEYTDSKQSCPGDTCSALTSKIKCEDETVAPGCVCKSGYRRKAVDGPCIPYCECPETTSDPACQKKQIKIHSIISYKFMRNV